MRNKLKRFIKNIEPRKYPNEKPEDTLREEGWNDYMIGTFEGQSRCVWVELQKVKRAVWEGMMQAIRGRRTK